MKIKISTDPSKVPTGAECISYDEWCQNFSDEIIIYKLEQLAPLEDIENWGQAVKSINAALTAIWVNECVYFWLAR